MSDDETRQAEARLRDITIHRVEKPTALAGLHELTFHAAGLNSSNTIHLDDDGMDMLTVCLLAYWKIKRTIECDPDGDGYIGHE